MKVKLVRRSQTLSPFGVGAIFDVEGESLVAVDISWWKNQGQEISEKRLEEMLGVKRFKMGPAAKDNPSANDPGIPYYRFPQWLFCPRCRSMSHWSKYGETGKPPECTECRRAPRQKLVPMRFVMACPRGHLADVPWRLWAHSGSHGKCEQWVLKFITTDEGGGLESLKVECKTCGASRSLAGIATPDSMRKLNVRCSGRQPWQERNDARSCNAIPQVVQRGASNLTFAVTTSSIDIPPFSNWSTFSSDRRLIAATDEYRIIRSDPDGVLVELLYKAIAQKLSMKAEVVRSLVQAEIREEMPKLYNITSARYTENELFSEEFDAFLAPDEEQDPRDHFIKRYVPLAKYLDEIVGGQYGSAVTWLGERLYAIVQATRLREVRVLNGFSRLAPAVGDNEDQEDTGTFSTYDTEEKIVPTVVAADLGLLPETDKWLPAVEVFGEGIFLSFKESEIQQWEDAFSVRKHIRPLAERFTHIRARSRYLPPPDPRFVLLHTLAHLLIRQLSFECGYSLASLRERIYVAEPDNGHPMAGILIYTAAGDVEGTLGGLVREGKADRLLSTIIKALQQAYWCSSDPLCRESKGQGMDAMNLAACHACALLPETSCAYSNRMLDRTLLLGSTENADIGFFAPLMVQLLQVTEEDHGGE